jgi:hypothetical protein
MNQLEFRQKLAEELLDFSFVMPERGRVRSQRAYALLIAICGLETAPLYAVTWTRTKWDFLKCNYSQHVFKTLGSQKRIQTYCRCMIGHWMCPTSIGIHIASVVEGS